MVSGVNFLNVFEDSFCPSFLSNWDYLERNGTSFIPSHLEHTFPHQNSHKLAVNPPKNPPDLNPLPASEKASS